MEFSDSNEEGKGRVGGYIGGYTPVARGGATAPPFFSSDFVANLKKKITLWACRSMGGRPGYIFEIFQNDIYF